MKEGSTDNRDEVLKTSLKGPAVSEARKTYTCASQIRESLDPPFLKLVCLGFLATEQVLCAKPLCWLQRKLRTIPSGL